MTLEIMIEEKESIKNKIDKALYKIKSWFEGKIEEAKSIMLNVKNNIAIKFKNKILELDKYLTNLQNDYDDAEKIVLNKKYNMSYINGEGKLIKSNSDFNSLKKEITKAIFDLIKKILGLCDNIIKLCKEGLLKLSKLDKEELPEINEIKADIKENFDQISANIKLIYSNNKSWGTLSREVKKEYKDEIKKLRITRSNF